MIDKFAERGLRSLAVAYQVKCITHVFMSYHRVNLVKIIDYCDQLMHRMFPMVERKAQEVPGNLLASCLCLTHLDMIVQILYEGH